MGAFQDMDESMETNAPSPVEKRRAANQEIETARGPIGLQGIKRL